MRIGHVILQIRVRQRDHLGNAVFGNLARERLGRITGDHRDRIAAALFRQFEAGIHGGQSGFREVASLMFGKDENVTHLHSLHYPLRAVHAVACGR